MVTYYNDYEIHITPSFDIIATKMMSGGIYESYSCYDGNWDKNPPDDIRAWYDRFSGRVTIWEESMAKHPAKNLAKKMQDKKEAPNPKAPVPLAKKMQEKKKK